MEVSMSHHKFVKIVVILTGLWTVTSTLGGPKDFLLVGDQAWDQGGVGFDYVCALSVLVEDVSNAEPRCVACVNTEGGACPPE